MKISELIKKLQEIEQNEGDLTVWNYTDTYKLKPISHLGTVLRRENTARENPNMDIYGKLKTNSKKALRPFWCSINSIFTYYRSRDENR